MPDETVVTLKLNQQQLELVDRTVARGVAPDRAALVAWKERSSGGGGQRDRG